MKLSKSQMSYKNLGIVKNYVGLFQSDVDEAIEKNKKKGWNDFKWLYRPQKYKPFDIYKTRDPTDPILDTGFLNVPNALGKSRG